MADTKGNSGKRVFQDKQKPAEVRASNITAAKGIYIILMLTFNYKLRTLGVADAIRTSLGPKGMDKMVSNVERKFNIT